jgi:ADP-ribosylglycohydrolase
MRYKAGMMGLIVADALGVPFEFKSREQMKKNPCTDMVGFGTYNLEPGCFSDDSTMAIATLDSLHSGYNPKDMMEKFVKWYLHGEYTPQGKLFDIGFATSEAIENYIQDQDIASCGLKKVENNGNGSLMRILPLCIYLVENKIEDNDAIEMIHEVSSLTHAHIRSKIACGIYYFICKEIMKKEDDLITCIQNGMNHAFEYYADLDLELFVFRRMKDCKYLMNINEEDIQSSGYVIHSLEASLWCLLNHDNYVDSVLHAVNLGRDTDTTAAITGGLAGLYYGYNAIPECWLKKIKRREYLEELCDL